MHEPSPAPPRRPAGRRAPVAWLLLAALLLGPPSPARSADVNVSPAAAPLPPVTEEQLKALVPARVGAWRRRSLAGPAPTGEADQAVVVEAEFRAGKREATLLVSSLGERADPWTGATIDRRSAEGTERAYGEAGNAVRETLRSRDGHAEVTLQRPDGVVVIVRAYHVPTAELKALAFGVKASAPPR